MCHLWSVPRGHARFWLGLSVQYLLIPEHERQRRVELGPDTCVVDGEWFFVRGCLDIPVQGHEEPFSWGVWCSLSHDSFLRYGKLFDQPSREPGESFSGWLCSAIPGYADTLQLKTMVRLRPWPARPFVELEPTDHALAVEQREGITMAQAREIAERILHPRGGSG